MTNSFPDDLNFQAIKQGARWYSFYSLPGRKNRQVKGSFDTEAKALRAAGSAMCNHFRDNTTGWFEQKITNKDEIEKVFGSKK